MQEQILLKLIERTASVFNKKTDEINGDTNFDDDLKAKSGDIVQITTFMEDEYDIEIPYMEFRRKKTLKEASEFIEMLEEG